MIRLSGAAVALVLAMPVRAEIPALCGDQPNQMAMDECADMFFTEADRALNATYAALLAKLDARTKPMARDAQRAWLAFRDKECVSQTGGGPDQEGTIWPMLYTECRIALTRQRTKELAEQVKCPGGDLSC